MRKEKDCFVTPLLAGDGSRHSIIENPSGTPCHLPDLPLLQGEVVRSTGGVVEALGTACLAKRRKAVVYDAATAGIARTFCGMFTVGTKASPERGGVPQGRRGF